MDNEQRPVTKWLVLFLGALTNAIAVAFPSMGLSVMLPEISTDLNMNLVQAGMVWGISAVPLIVSSLFAGSLSDRFGPKRVMLVNIIFIGLLGALRGLATSYHFLLFAVLASSLLAPLVTISNLKNARIWFTNRQLGFASGVLSLGMAGGFFMSAIISASVLSPWLGGWRNVFFLYSGLALLFIAPWLFVPSSPAGYHHADAESHPSFFASVGYVARLRNIWLLGIGALFAGGGIQGVIGYLPLYLHGIGWSEASAAGVVGAFNAASMLCVLPVTLLSDRLNSRKKLTIFTAFLTASGVAMLIFAQGAWIWGSAAVAGLLRDSFMALFLAMVIEFSGSNHQYSGTATGFAMVLYGIGTLIAPPLGNSLANGGIGLPFVFWTVSILLGCLLISFTKEANVRVVETSRMAASIDRAE